MDILYWLKCFRKFITQNEFQNQSSKVQIYCLLMPFQKPVFLRRCFCVNLVCYYPCNLLLGTVKSFTRASAGNPRAVTTNYHLRFPRTCSHLVSLVTVLSGLVCFQVSADNNRQVIIVQQQTCTLLEETHIVGETEMHRQTNALHSWFIFAHTCTHIYIKNQYGIGHCWNTIMISLCKTKTYYSSPSPSSPMLSVPTSS